MAQSRLSLALGPDGVRLPPEGKIAVFRPRAGYDLSAFPKSRVEVVQGFFPDHQVFLKSGFAVTVAPDGDYSAAVVVLPRSKPEARALVFQAVAAVHEGGPIIVDGQKTDGVESLLKAVKHRVEIGGSIPKSHGRVFWFAAAPAFDDWAQQPRRIDGGYQTLPGVFSSDGPDPASVLLAENLPARLPGRVADLGAGWGYLSRAILDRSGVEELHLIEADHSALDCARINVTDARARFHWADALSFEPAEKFDAVVMNPPFHTDRSGDPALGRAFIAAAARLLKAHGDLWMVANRHLPYEATLAEHFREPREVAGNSAFKVIHGQRRRVSTRNRK